MYLEQQKKLAECLRTALREQYGIEPGALSTEQPPEVRFGEYASPIAFELARSLRKSPRKIAEELIAKLPVPEGFASFEVAGAGYINAKLDRGRFVSEFARSGGSSPTGNQDVLVEHTSINPNKAAHIGHLRNAILGDTLAKLLVAHGSSVTVQNYIDNTGVQVADVVVGLVYIEGYDLAGVKHLLDELAAGGKRIDDYCWDLYAYVSQWYDAEPQEKERRRNLRLETLHAIERAGNETAEIADLLSTAILRRHLETMLRLGIEYDFLPRESEILHLHFWEEAFRRMREKGVLYLETDGKNQGCWVMRRPGATAEDLKGPDEDAKVIVRSNGTVTYVGKDIAYHLWKFGLLGRDFGCRRFEKYPPSKSFPEGRQCWISADSSDEGHPRFGNADAIYNVIDSRQSDPQANVIEALRGMGYTKQAANYTHFSYEMVALTPRCAVELGYGVPEEDRGRAYIEVSGRKGFGVKADDLIDKLLAATRSEVESRHPELDAQQRERIAGEIAVGALRYFMLKYTRNTVIAFDFKDALSFEGETGPYMQYAIVRIRSIFRKAGIAGERALAEFVGVDAAPYLTGEEAEGIWAVWLRAAKTTLLLDQCIATGEPAYLAKHVFQLAQEFSNFYRKHHILTESDPRRKKFLLATAAVVERELVCALGWLGIAAPEVM